MAGRRPLLAVLALAAALHLWGASRSLLPAQDGLKFLRVARGFQTRPWADVVRDSDQHPLYPALVALTEPAVSRVIGPGPSSWRLAAQLVAMAAGIALLVPLHGLALTLFGRGPANLAVLGFVLLPLPMALGHDTLSDTLALAAFLTSLRLGLAALRSGAWAPALGCGVVAGLGFLVRPEVAAAPVAVVAAGLVPRILAAVRTGAEPAAIESQAFVGSAVRTGSIRQTVRTADPTADLATRAASAGVGARLAGVGLSLLVVVGAYTLVKGQVTEKLAVRLAVNARPAAAPRPASRTANQWLPPGLNDPRWDFAPKEEPDRPDRRSLGAVVGDLAFQWAEGLGWLLALFATWGLVRDRFIRDRIAESSGKYPDPGGHGRLVVGAYLALFVPVLIRHELRMGYLSHRHVLTLVVLALPWAAAGVYVCATRAAWLLRLSGRTSRWAGGLILAVAVVVGVSLQLKPPHPSRWGHWAAGRWLAEHAGPGQAVLDTRGWAAFVCGRPSYDAWHIRQALTDSLLGYVVVGDDELKAPSRRGATLRALLAYAAEPAASFPEREGGREPGVWVYRYKRPATWEGLVR